MDYNEKFSERMGLEKPDDAFQISSMSPKLRTALYNAFYLYFYTEENAAFDQVDRDSISKLIWMKEFGKPLDEFRGSSQCIELLIKPLFITGDWYKIYNFLELLYHLMKFVFYDYNDFARIINIVLTEHRSGFKLRKHIFIPITNEAEVKEISELEKKTIKYKLKEVRIHLDTALMHLSLKPDPDLRNSIKESISMVGTIARMIGGENDLGKALHAIKKKEQINPLLADSFKMLYNFTNGKDGIRHELMKDTNLDLETARFFLISCSAFTNYLIALAIKDGTLGENNMKV